MRWVALVVALGLLAGCGGSHAPLTASTGSSATTASRAATVSARASVTAHAAATNPAYSYLPGALVTMRQFSPQSLLWQTISIQPNGRGLLTTLIGEISGAVRRHFELSAAQKVTVSRLAVTAARVAPSTSHDPRAELYTLTLRGRPAENLQGEMPPALSALTRYLSGLMTSYCC